MSQQPVTQTIKASEARQHFSQLLNRVFRKETRVIVEKSGIPVAAIISADDLRRLDDLDREQREAAAVLARMRAPFKDVPPEQIERDVAAVIAEMRAEDEARQRQPA